MRKGNREGIKQNVRVRSNVVSGILVLTGSNKDTLVDVLQQGTPLLRL